MGALVLVAGEDVIRSDRDHRRRLGIGVAGSTLVHVLFVALLLYISSRDTPPKTDLVVQVELVAWPGPAGSAAATAAPAGAAPAAAQPAPTPQPGPAAKPPKPKAPKPADELGDKLKAFAQLRVPDAPAAAPRDGGAQAGTGPAAGQGSGAAGLADLIRVEVERRWHVDRDQLPDGPVTLTLRLVLNRDGTVASLEILPTAGQQDDPQFPRLAHSARTAVLVSAPYPLPPGLTERQRTVLVRLDPRASLR
jgi:hypothetical protein